MRKSLEELIITCAFDATFFHFGIAVNVSVGKTASFDKENLNSQQNDSEKKQNHSKNEYLHGFYLKNACKFKKGF